MKRHVFFIGIGGIGMSALAKYYTHQGYRVAGYDKTPSAITKELEGLNVFCLFEESEALLQDLYREVPNELLEVVYTPAVPMNSCNVTYFLNRGLPIKKRSEVLGQITRNHKTIAIAGTHGKTTTTTLVTHLLKSAGCNITSFMGGLSANYNTNYISGNPSQDNHWMIVEADEFDRSFHQLEPDYVILTSMDADHLDIYNSIEEVEKSYQQFINKLKPNGTLIVKNSVNNQIVFSGKKLSYDLNLKVHYSAGNIHFTSDASSIFDFNATDKTWKNLKCSVPGIHNIENALAALALAHCLGINESQARSGLASFKGVSRRFDIRYSSNRFYFIDDYAHHPTELRAAIQSCRTLFPNLPLTGIFQPHLYSRTRDFKNEFAQVLSTLDHCILMPIYPARELPIPGVSSEDLLEAVTAPQKQLMQPAQILEYIKTQRLGVIITMGAGDIGELANDLALQFKTQLHED